MFNLEDYETVEERLVKFWKEHPDGRIATQLLDSSNGRYIVQAYIYRTEVDQHAWATGLAEETITGRGVNATSALENCETSAIGRALASAGYATKGKRPSREEMTKVAAKQNNEALIQQTKAKMAQTATEYVPVPTEEDVWTIKQAPPTQTAEQAVEMVKQVLGGTMVDESCVHGNRIWKTGTSKAGKPWGHWRCPEAGHPLNDPCEPIWYEIASDGSWKPRAVKS